MATATKDDLLAMIREQRPMTTRQQLRLTALLSLPAILAQLTSIVMQYIDAAMVGRLGADDSASIGLVSTTTWLFGGICGAVATGFSVQVAHSIGANKMAQARDVLRQALVTSLVVGLVLGTICFAISGPLPQWLRGGEAIQANASLYFRIFAFCVPVLLLDFLASGMLRCSGNIKVPSIMNVMMGVLDVIFNFFLIFPDHHFTVLGLQVNLPGAGWGVKGAAIGTLLAEGVTCVCMMSYLLLRSREMNLLQDRGSFRPTRQVLARALKIGTPIGLQQVTMCGAQIAITRIVAPLGSIAISANAFAVTAESLCYMPGYGISDAATTLVGQSIGARRRDLTRRFARITVVMGMVVMGFMGVLMWLFAPLMMGLMSPVQGIVDLGADCLRIEAWAEPLFAAAIVSYGIFVGAGDTLVPCVMNIASMWCVRLTLAYALVSTMGLTGVWTAMCCELVFRGLIFLVRLRGGRWVKIKEEQGNLVNNQVNYISEQ